jgi:hypothetical protein
MSIQKHDCKKQNTSHQGCLWSSELRGLWDSVKHLEGSVSPRSGMRFCWLTTAKPTFDIVSREPSVCQKFPLLIFNCNNSSLLSSSISLSQHSTLRTSITQYKSQ